MSHDSKKLKQDDVVFFEDENQTLFTKTFKVSDFYDWLCRIFYDSIVGSKEKKENFVGEGTDCHVLQPGQNWKKGKIRIAIEFIPDESESPLDDVRQDNSNHEE